MAFQPPRLGPGAIYLRSLDALFRSHSDLIRVAEIEPQGFWTKGSLRDSVPRGSRVELRHLSKLPQRILTHGVGSPIGGSICDHERQAPEFRRWNEELRAPWTSEHLSILHVRGAHDDGPCGFLMPPLQTDAAVKLAAANIRRRSAALEKPFAFETGVNYFAPREFEMPDGEFFRAVAEEADCGILLDLTNLWVNDRNGRAKIGDVLARLPLERVWEVHVAGIEFAHGYWLDAHSNGVDAELAAIAAEVIVELPNLGAVIFEIAPDRTQRFGAKAFLMEMEKVHGLWEKARFRSAPKRAAQAPLADGAAPSPEAWERLIADRMLPMTERPAKDATEMAVSAEDEGRFTLYAELAASFRRGAVADLLENTTRLLLLGIGEEALRDLMHGYIRATQPAAFPSDEVLSFRGFLREHPVDVPGLDDMLTFEAAVVEAAADGSVLRVDLEKDVDVMLAEIAAGRLPGSASDRPGTVLEIDVGPVPEIRMVH